MTKKRLKKIRSWFSAREFFFHKTPASCSVGYYYSLVILFSCKTCVALFAFAQRFEHKLYVSKVGIATVTSCLRTVVLNLRVFHRLQCRHCSLCILTVKPVRWPGEEVWLGDQSSVQQAGWFCTSHPDRWVQECIQSQFAKKWIV